ncbi:hypothetical protein BaRGS_00014757 [Batillaria attramentaria]|uniref:Uncharacterized protein n=1 Tax=Batillaria attramentaria TaxID=370345 RepID=A0ABD0L3E9_9CAEN
MADRPRERVMSFPVSYGVPKRLSSASFVSVAPGEWRAGTMFVLMSSWLPVCGCSNCHTCALPVLISLPAAHLLAQVTPCCGP